MAKSNDPSNPEELVKYIASCLVENADKIDIETVESYSQTSIGDIYTEDIGNLILKRLFETNLFSNIQIKRSLIIK